jgi:hypothetical protein
MMRWYLLLLLSPMPGQAQPFTTADLRQLKVYSTGLFSNDGQVKADTRSIKSGLKVQPLWPKRKDGIWLFAERTDTAQYYQVWHFYLQDDTTLLMQFLDFKDSAKAVQLSRDIKQEADLYLYHLITRHGCEVYLKKNKKGYSGSSSGKECFTGVPGTEYLAFSMAFTKTGIDWKEQSFDKDDKELGSSNYSYTRQVTSLK